MSQTMRAHASRRIGGQRVVLGHVRRRDAVRAERRGRLAAPPTSSAWTGSPREAARERQGLQRDLVARRRVLDEHEDHQTTPSPRSISTTARRGVGAVAEHLGLLALALGHHQPHHLEPRRAAAGGSTARPASPRAQLRPGTDG